MSNDDRDMLERVQQYRQLVLRYEALDAEIDALIMSHGGASEKLPKEAFERYRTLARERDEVHNEMRLLEQQLLDDE